jgi:hypothetical protein
MAHTPGPRCTECTWIHEADSTAGTSFQGVGLCALHASAPELLAALKYALVQVAQDNNERSLPIEHRQTENMIRSAIARAEGRL